jgi:hypothetical protein
MKNQAWSSFKRSKEVTGQSNKNREADATKNREVHGRAEVDIVEEKKRTGELDFCLIFWL